jgi:hypothetical protein
MLFVGVNLNHVNSLSNDKVLAGASPCSPERRTSVQVRHLPQQRKVDCLKTPSITIRNVAVMSCLAFVLNQSTAQVREVEIFSPGVVSGPAGHYAPTFSPDCRTVYSTVGNAADAVVLVSHFDGKVWMRPQIVEFSGRWEDLEPALSPDGSYMIFVSNRPAQVSGKPLRAAYE